MPADPARVESLFARALAVPPADRAAFVAVACGPDPDLRGRVDRLLAAHADLEAGPDPAATSALPADPVTRTAPGAEAPRSPEPTADHDPAPDEGTVIGGRYKLLQQIGEGGMGTVWMADQLHPVRRKVAVKLVKAGMDSRRVLARFEAERQALALMDHPHIAKVLDAGATDRGAPYFVMELVKGVPLTQFCDAHRLTVPQRLELFQQICSAVQHAHQKGVIHRDLKPGNVLVESHDGRPVPKVIDFGLAKAVSELPLADRSLFTAYGAVMGTPQYMAPEQASFNAVDIDTRADIYALGVILYELLTGSPPIEKDRLRQAALDEVLKVIREEDPPTPSHRLSTLDAAPSVAANRQTEPRKLGRLVRGDLDWMVMKALAKDRSRRYETANGFAADVGRYLAGEPVLAVPPSAGYRLRKFARRNRPQVVAAGVVLFALVAGIVGTTLGLVEARRQGAVAVRERDAADAARQAEADQRAVAVAERDEKEKARAAEAEQKRVAEEKAKESNALVKFFEEKVFAAGRPKGQAGGLGKDVTLRAAVAASVPALAARFRDQPLLEARLRQKLGTTFLYLGEAEAAREQFERARAIHAERLGPDHQDTLASMNDLAIGYHDLGWYDDALALREAMLAARKRVLGPDHPDTLVSMHNLAVSYTALGRHADALKLNEEALAARKEVLPADHPDTLGSMQNLAAGYGRLGRYADARKLLEEALAAQKRTLPADHPETLMTMTNLAITYACLDRYADALKLGEETLASQKRALPLDHPETLMTMHNLAITYSLLDRYADALKLGEETLAALRRALGPDHPKTLGSMWSVAQLQVLLGRGAEAVPLIDECLTRAAGKPLDPKLIPAVTDLRLRHFQKAGDPAGCRATAEMWEKLGRRDTDSLCTVARMRAVAAGVYAKKGQPAEAAADADRAMDWLRKAVAAGYRDRAHMDRDADLDALRGRPDFKALVGSLPVTAPPPRPAK